MGCESFWEKETGTHRSYGKLATSRQRQRLQKNQPGPWFSFQNASLQYHKVRTVCCFKLSALYHVVVATKASRDRWRLALIRPRWWQ